MSDPAPSAPPPLPPRKRGPLWPLFLLPLSGILTLGILIAEGGLSTAGFADDLLGMMVGLVILHGLFMGYWIGRLLSRKAGWIILSTIMFGSGTILLNVALFFFGCICSGG